MGKPTRFSSYPAHAAAVVLAGALVLIAIGLTNLPRGAATNKGGIGDGRLWQNVIDRMRGGDSYYSAMNLALRTTGPYALRPFVNFRLPLLASAVALLPSDKIACAVMCCLACAVLVVWVYEIKLRLGLLWAGLTGFMLTLPVLGSTTPLAFLFHDMWAGLLIALSIWFCSRHRAASIACGLLALAIREQALVFVLVMCVLAIGERRRSEAVAWIVGIAAFAVYMVIHAHLAGQYIRPDDPARTWVAFAGWKFVVSTASWTLLTLTTPVWVSAVAVPLALLGAGGYPDAVGARLAAALAAYVTTFVFVGNPDNAYWGLLYSPLLSIGIVCSLPALRDLVTAVAQNRGPVK